MDNSEQNYRQKIWEFLDNMAPGDAFLIDNLCKPENRGNFILCVKSYMDANTPFQGYITFNRDYSKIYKTNEITFKKEVTNE